MYIAANLLRDFQPVGISAKKKLNDNALLAEWLNSHLRDDINVAAWMATTKAHESLTEESSLYTNTSRRAVKIDDSLVRLPIIKKREHFCNPSQGERRGITIDLRTRDEAASFPQLLSRWGEHSGISLSETSPVARRYSMLITRSPRGDTDGTERY